MPLITIPRAYTLAEIESDPVPIICQVQEVWPDVHWGGIGLRAVHKEPGVPGGTAAYYRMLHDALAKERAEMIDERGVGQFLRAARFIDAVPRTATVNRKHGCYGWKHRAEHYAERVDPAGHHYVGEGMFATAAIAMGLLLYCRNDGHCMVNLGAKAWEMGCRDHMWPKKVAA